MATSDALIQKIRELMPKREALKLPKKIAVILLSRKKSRELNWTYRKKNMPTNTLSFRYDAQYGEILVCADVIRREAKTRGNSYAYQMTWMVVHGMLHLAGLHHEESGSAAKRVEKLERQILDTLF